MNTKKRVLGGITFFSCLTAGTLAFAQNYGDFADGGCEGTKRKWSAILWNIRGEWEPACKNHVELKWGRAADRCEENGFHMWGVFLEPDEKCGYVFSQPPNVQPVENAHTMQYGDFRDFTDNGCIGPGFRNYSSVLRNISGSWETACETHKYAPLQRVADNCVNTGQMWGEFYVEDPNCDLGTTLSDGSQGDLDDSYKTDNYVDYNLFDHIKKRFEVGESKGGNNRTPAERAAREKNASIPRLDKAKPMRFELPSYTQIHPRTGTYWHVQGITATSDGRIVLNHSLNPIRSQNIPNKRYNCSTIIWSDTIQSDNFSPEDSYDSDKAMSANCAFENWHPSVLQSAGKLVVASDNHDSDGSFDNNVTRNVSPNKIRFFQIASGSEIKEFKDLAIQGHYNSVAIAFNPADQHTYVTAADPADAASTELRIYRDDDGTGQPCPNLANSGCTFKEHGTIDDVFVSSSGMSLISQNDGTMVLFSMYSPNGNPDDYMRIVEIDPANKTKGRSSGEIWLFRTEELAVKTLRASCRWGCSVEVINGELYLLTAPRHLQEEQFEIRSLKLIREL